MYTYFKRMTRISSYAKCVCVYILSERQEVTSLQTRSEYIYTQMASLRIYTHKWQVYAYIHTNGKLTHIHTQMASLRIYTHIYKRMAISDLSPYAKRGEILNDAFSCTRNGRLSESQSHWVCC